MANSPFRLPETHIYTNPDDDTGLELYDHGDVANKIIELRKHVKETETFLL